MNLRTNSIYCTLFTFHFRKTVCTNQCQTLFATEILNSKQSPRTQPCFKPMGFLRIQKCNDVTCQFHFAKFYNLRHKQKCVKGYSASMTLFLFYFVKKSSDVTTVELKLFRLCKIHHHSTEHFQNV